MSVRQVKRARVSRDLVTAAVATFALIALSIAFGGSPSSRASGDSRPSLRLGYFPNVTHAPALVGISRGDFQRELPGYFVESRVVNAGPEAMEALLAGEIDVAYVGPSPAVNTYLKSHGTALRIVAGACSGGASLVSRGDVDIQSVADLDHKRIAVPQLGGTQDVSLRHFLDLSNLAPLDRGGSVEVIPVKNPDILALFIQKQIDAAWVPEPWASRLVADAGARRVVDERDLWPNKTFMTTVVVARSKFVVAHPEAVQAMLRAHYETIEWINSHPDEARTNVNSELKKLTGKSLSNSVLTEAWQHVTFTDVLDRTNILAMAQAAKKAGYLKGSLDLTGAFDATPLALAKQLRQIGAR